MTQAIFSLLKDPPLNTTVTVKGWIRSRRDSKAGLSFLTINDGSCFASLQAIAASSLANYETEILRLTKDCAVIVTGTLVKSQGGEQAVEIQAETVKVVGWIEDPETYPISPKRHTMEHLRDYAHLRVRTNIMSAVTRVRACAAQAIHRFFSEEGFFWLNTPIITASDCEGAGELFRITTLDLEKLPKTPQGKVDFSQDFFGQESFLTVSGQLNAESYALGMGKIYTFGPTFRAENSNTTRHLAEFWMIEPEMAFADLQDDVKLAEQLLKYVIKAVLTERADDMAFFNEWVDKNCLERLNHVVSAEFQQMTYSKAIEVLIESKKTFAYPVKWGLDLQTEHERFLCEEIVKAPVAIINYPKEIKAFYMRLNEDDKTVAAMDVLVPGIGEIIGGSQREERLDRLDSRILEAGMRLEDYHWYRDLRRYGGAPHAGFGLGFERLVCYLTGIGNIRDAHPFPRAPGYVKF